jgi:hypothetical protein
MYEADQSSAGAPRGTQLLEEFLDIVPEIGRLSEDMASQAAATIALLSQYWECLSEHIDEHDDKFRFDLVRGLRKLHNLHCEKNVPVACGALIVALNIEAWCYYDEDAKLVRSLTALQLAKARASGSGVR